MEQKDIFEAWKTLNDKLNEKELANTKTLIFILESKRKSALQNLMIMDKIATAFMLIISIVIVCYLFSHSVESLLIKIEATVMLVSATVLNMIALCLLRKMNFSLPVVTLFQHVVNYRKLTVFIYVLIYVLAVIMIITLLLTTSSGLVKTLLLIIVPLGVCIDFFLFNWTMRQLNILIEMTKEMKTLKEEKRQE